MFQLRTYNTVSDSLIAKINYPTIFLAVLAGYESNRNFLVVAAFGEPKQYWNGKPSDKQREDFETWPDVAQRKDFLTSTS